MKNLPWFRLYSEFLTDPVIRLLSFEDQRHFIAVLCMKASGVLDKDYCSGALRNDVISQLVGLSALTPNGENDSALELAKARLRKVGLIDEAWQPVNWDKRQYRSDSQDPTNAIRQQKHREKLKAEMAVSNARYVTEVTALDTDTDTDTDKTPIVPKGDVVVVFEHWKSVHEHPRAKLDAKRTRLIRGALKSYAPDDLRAAIEGYKKSDWHQGKNERRAVFDDLGMILRDADHIDKGIALNQQLRSERWV